MFNNSTGVFWAFSIFCNFWRKLLTTIKAIYYRGRGNNGGSKLTHSLKTKREDRMPQAKGLPLVGTLIDLILAGAAPKLHKYIDKRHQELGPIFQECLGGTQDAVFISSADLMRKVFLYEGQHPQHPLPEAWTLYNKIHNCQRGLFFMDGTEWLCNRRLLNRFLLNGNQSWMNKPIEACTEKVIKAWEEQACERCNITDLEPQLYRWAIEVVCSIMFGVFTTNAEISLALKEFSRIVHKVFESSAALMSFPPRVAKVLKSKRWSRFEGNVSQVLQQGASIIDMFVLMSNNEASTEEEAPLFAKLQAAGMELPMIKRIFVDLVIAAGDTTAYTTEWALYLLSKDASLQLKLAKEVTEVGWENADLVRGLIKETLRLYPVAPFIGRYMACDAIIGGYNIKKDTLVLLSLYTAGREALHFPDPYAVKPERWQRDMETGQLLEVLNAHGSLPFAIGARSCIGRKVALSQMQCLLAAVARSFHTKCLNTKPLRCILRLVTVPDEPLVLAVKLREKFDESYGGSIKENTW